jgi:threonine aldolase
MIECQMQDRGVVHRAQPGVVTIAQSTEMGTIYSVAEIQALAETAHRHKLYLHMDGARIGNAAAAFGATFREFTTDAGVDILSFGGTKIGAMAAEAVVVLNPALAASLPFLRKTSMQLASKQRFISAQLNTLLKDDGELALANGRHANAMAARLDAGLRALGVPVPHPTQANAVFPIFDADVITKLQQSFRFYVWRPATGQVRLMCAWDTTEADVDALLTAVATLMG